MKSFIAVFGAFILFLGMCTYVLFFGYPEPFGFYIGIAAAACGVGIAVKEISCRL